MKRLLVLLVLAGCAKTEAPKTAAPIVVAGVDVTLVKRAPIETGPRLAGSLEAREQAVIRAEVGGSVMSMSCEIGDVVHRGQVLARIEAGSLEDALRSATMQVTSATVEHEALVKQAERVALLVKGGALAQRELESAETQAALAQSRLEAARASQTQAREKLSWATVTSPMNGVVSARAVSAGDVVGASSAMCTVIDPSSMRLRAAVPSDALSVVRVGAPVGFRVRGYPDQVFAGVIDRIAPAADEITRQIPVWVKIPNPGGKLVAGLFAEGRVSEQAREGLIVPLAAVNLVSTPPSVKRVVADRVEDVSVGVGLRDEASQTIEIIQGVSEGDLLLRGAASSIAAGASVSLKERPMSAKDDNNADL